MDLDDIIKMIVLLLFFVLPTVGRFLRFLSRRNEPAPQRSAQQSEEGKASVAEQVRAAFEEMSRELEQEGTSRTSSRGADEADEDWGDWHEDAEIGDDDLGIVATTVAPGDRPFVWEPGGADSTASEWEEASEREAFLAAQTRLTDLVRRQERTQARLAAIENYQPQSFASREIFRDALVLDAILHRPEPGRAPVRRRQARNLGSRGMR